MKVKIRKSEVGGRVGAPPSKSMTHRALICSALAAGESVIRSPLVSDDTQATLRVLRGLGLDVSEGSGFWGVHGGTLKEPDMDLFCGESGTTLRLVTAVCSLTNGECKLTGGPSLSRRPVEPLLEGLGQLGVDCESAGGFPPVKVRGRGKIRNGEVEMRGDISSQFVSAILLVAPFGDGATRIKLTTPLESRPYVRMTMDVQRIFGVEIQASDDMRAYRVERQAYRPADMAIEGDWSSATYLLAAGALAGGVTVENLNPGSGQADAAIIDILEGMGVQVKRRGSSFSVEKTELRAVEADLSDSPDLFPVVASLCSAASGKSVLRGLRRLRYKESDRVAAMVEGLDRMGVKTARERDSLVIEGGRINGGVIDPSNDHRIAMALSILGLVAEGETTILNAGCVSKSYPGFWEDMKRIGAEIWRSRND
jgi:3-phosphoshikimate 1-carboxyvinyltransferase